MNSLFLLRQWLSVFGCVFIWLEISWQHHILYLRALQSLPWYLLLVSNIELVICSLTEDYNVDIHVVQTVHAPLSPSNVRKSNPVINFQSFDWLWLDSLKELNRTQPKILPIKRNRTLRQSNVKPLSIHLVSNKALPSNKSCIGSNTSSVCCLVSEHFSVTLQLLSFLSRKSFWPYLVLNITNKSLNFKINLDR